MRMMNCDCNQLFMDKNSQFRLTARFQSLNLHKVG